MVKIKLRNFDSVVYTEEHTQDVKYTYSIDDSLGLLGIELTIPEDADPVEYFVLHLKDLYKGYPTYECIHGKWKYTLSIDKNKYINEWYLSKVKMW